MAAAQKKEHKLYQITVTGAAGGASTYYAAGEDAHECYSRLVAHDEKEGNWSHQDMLSLAIDVEEVDLATAQFVAWELGS